jgi:hypothetical protein
VPSPFVFLLALLGVYRLSHMIAMEEGPFDAFAELREKAGQRTWIGRGLHCPLCLSFWIALVFAVAITNPTNIALVWLGLAGGCLVLHRLLYGGD